MQMSYPVESYLTCIQKAFCELLVGYQYASELPNLDRFTKFLTRIKEAEFDSGNPIAGLTTTDLCKKGLPVNWVFIQYNRGPLLIVEEDEFRVQLIRCFTDESRRCFDEDDFGFGSCELNFWMVGNNGASIESAEALYYMRLYKLKSIDFLYLGYPFHARINHEMFQSFEPIGINEYGTGFSVQWRLTMYVPILRQELEGFNIAEVCTEIYDGLEIHCPPPFPGPVMDDDDLDISRQLGARETLITSANDDGSIDIDRIPGAATDKE